MLQIELVAVFTGLASFNLAIFIAICFSHKKKSIDRINGLKIEWFISLPLQFMELADDIIEERIDDKQAPKEIKKIIASYDALEDLEKAYVGANPNNIITMLSMNFVFILISAGLALFATYLQEQQLVVMISGLSLASLVYFFVFIFKILNFIRREEDNFQKIERDLQTEID